MSARRAARSLTRRCRGIPNVHLLDVRLGSADFLDLQVAPAGSGILCAMLGGVIALAWDRWKRRKQLWARA